MEITQPRTRVSNSALIIFFFLALLAASLGIFRYFWMQSFLSQSRESAFKLAQQLGAFAASTGEIEAQIWKEFIRKEDRLAYVIVEYAPLAYQESFFHRERITFASPALSKYLKQYDRGKVSQLLIRDNRGFATDNLHVVVAEMISSSGNEGNEKIGRVKIGYVVPGRAFAVIPLGRAYFYLMVFGYTMGALLFVFLFMRPLRWRSYVKGSLAKHKKEIRVQAEEPDYTWVEDETGKTEPIYIDEAGRSWKILIPDGNISLWELKGSSFISAGELVLKPWGSSCVRTDLDLSGSYTFKANIYKMAGSGGPLILFQCEKKNLVWALGASNNTQSFLASYDQTHAKMSLALNQWHQIELRVSPTHVTGLLDHKVVWTLDRAAIDTHSPEVGFKKGLGVAVWDAMVRFDEVRFLQE